jgi:hypothetical protein
MGYEKQNFKTGQKLYASQLEAMEDGIIAVEQVGENLAKEIGDIETVMDEVITFQNILIGGTK